MNARCRNGSGLNKARYFDRGITVSVEWVHDPKVFIDWALSNGWEKGKEIDRIDNNKGYSPENCRWVTHKENCRNKTNNHLITYQGRTLCINAWAEELNVDRDFIRKRLAMFPHEKVIESIKNDFERFPKHLRIRQVPWTQKVSNQR